MRRKEGCQLEAGRPDRDLVASTLPFSLPRKTHNYVSEGRVVVSPIVRPVVEKGGSAEGLNLKERVGGELKFRGKGGGGEEESSSPEDSSSPGRREQTGRERERQRER